MRRGLRGAGEACAAFGFVVAAVAAGCAKGVPGPGDPGYVAHLTARAQQLAVAELERIRAVELTYKNEARFHQNIYHPDQPTSGVYLKLYRDYKSCEVYDLKQTTSLVHPLAFEIAFTYDVYATTPRPSAEPTSPASARHDEAFERVRENISVLRRYPCSAEGVYTPGVLPDLPDVRQFYDLPASGARIVETSDRAFTEEPAGRGRTVVSPMGGAGPAF